MSFIALVGKANKICNEFEGDQLNISALRYANAIFFSM
jgi:hypothetical protein